VSLFVDPDPEQLEAAARTGAPLIELHTGAYAEQHGTARDVELTRLRRAALRARELGLVVNAGHGLHRHNLEPIVALPGVEELNIGHAIVARALFVGMREAVSEIRRAMDGAR
jgi:pyridoxine 5-phosphate synthase